MIDSAPITRIDPKSIKLLKGNRQGRDEARFQELKESMQSHGLINPVLVRVGELDDPPVHVCIAGEQRIKAAIELGWALIAARVMVNVPDDEARELQLIENLQRQDLTPWEEAEQLANLKKLHPQEALEALADRVGKSPPWVAQRLAFNKLDKGLRALVQEQNWPLSHLPPLARMPAESQKLLLAEIQERQKRSHDWSEWQNGGKSIPVVPTLRSLDSLLGQFQHLLSAAHWKLDDAKLAPKAGACSSCPKRSSSQAVLFPEVTQEKQDRCLDLECWQNKLTTFVVLQTDKLKEKGKPVYLRDGYREVSQEIELRLGKPKLEQEWNYEKCKEGEKGAQPAIYVNGDKIGQVKWVKPARSSSSDTMPSRRNQETGKVKPRTTKERLETLTHKRKCRAVELWADKLEGLEPEFFDVVAVVAVFGTHGTHTYLYGDKSWPDVKKLKAGSELDQAALLWKSSFEVLRSRCRRTGPMEAQAEGLWDEAVAQSKALNREMEFADCWGTAAKEIKFPKSLEKAGVEDPHTGTKLPDQPAKKKKAKVR